MQFHNKGKEPAKNQSEFEPKIAS